MAVKASRIVAKGMAKGKEQRAKGMAKGGLFKYMQVLGLFEGSTGCLEKCPFGLWPFNLLALR
jgi:hypothetical protein